MDPLPRDVANHCAVLKEQKHKAREAVSFLQKNCTQGMQDAGSKFRRKGLFSRNRACAAASSTGAQVTTSTRTIDKGPHLVYLSHQQYVKFPFTNITASPALTSTVRRVKIGEGQAVNELETNGACGTQHGSKDNAEELL